MRIINIKKVKEITNLSRSTIWRLEIKGLFPQRIILSPGRVGWNEVEVIEWVKSLKKVGKGKKMGSEI